MIRMTFTQLMCAVILTGLITLLPAGRSNAAPAGEGTPVSITGELTVLYMDDFENKRAELQYFIEDKQSKKRFRLRFDHTPSGHLRTGSTVTVRGKAKGKEVFLAADGVESSNTEIPAPSTAAVTGEQRTIVLMTDFTDVSVSCSVNGIRDLMFTDPASNSINDLYQETSLGQISFTGDVIGPYQINHSSTDACDVNAWAAAADTAAQNNGVDLSLYDRKVYVLPDANSCGWSGLASVGGNPSYAWIFRCDLEAVFGHELGHNLGMNHASTLSSEYGDTSDIMGSAMSGLRQLNGPHQEQMGWRSPDMITTVTQGGTFDIAPLELSAAQALAPQVLKFAKPDSDETYYLSYRQPIGFDANLSTSLTERLHIHLYKGNGGKTTLLSGLLVGASFVDDVNGITVTHVSHMPDYATVQVQIDGSTPTPTCTPTTPLVRLSPFSQSANAGSTLTYSVSITNNDNSACANSTFTLNDNIQSGWTGTLSPSSLSLAPGQTGTATLSVTSSVTAVASSYAVGVTIVDASEAAHTATGSADYVVLSSCSSGTPAMTVSPASQSGLPGTTRAYTVAITNTDDSACAPGTFSLSRSVPNGWTGTISPSSLSLVPGQTGQTTLSVTSPSSAATGSHIVNVDVSDSGEPIHTTSRSATYTVQATSDSESPTAPTGLSASVKRKQVNLAWNPSVDDVGISGYRVFRNAALLADTADASYNDRAISSGMTYSYYVVAYDATGNVSAPSNTVSVTIGNGGGNSGSGGGKTRKK